MPKNLLLADDSITIQKVVGITFAGEDFKITSVDNGEDAIARARAMRPDVVLADVVMPKRNGYEVCEAIKGDPALQHIPVLLLAGTFEAFDESRARAARADGHIAKPFESQALINKVKELVGGSSPSPAAQDARPGPRAAPSAPARQAPFAPSASSPASAGQPPQARAPAPDRSSAAPAPAAPSQPRERAPNRDERGQGQGQASPSPAIGRPPVAPPPPAARPPMPSAPPRPATPPAGASPRPGMPPGARPPVPATPPGGRAPISPPPGLRPPVPSQAPAGAPPRPVGVGVRPPFAASPAPAPSRQPSQARAPTPHHDEVPSGARDERGQGQGQALAPESPVSAALQREEPVKADASAMLSASSFELDWNDVDVTEEPAPASKASSSDARAVQPSPRDVAPPQTAPAPIVGHPPAPAAAAPIIGYPPSARREPELSSPPPASSSPAPAPIPSADVVPLEELDFGESPFAAPPRPLVQPPPEPEPVDLPMLEAEEEIELTPAAELTPGPDAGPRLADAKAEPPSSARPSVPKPLPADAGWTVAPAAPDLIPAPGATAPQPSAAAVPADGGEAQLREALSRASREVIERIAWEVVPQLAETIIREQIDRLAKDRQR